jgi:hypothetical protein
LKVEVENIFLLLHYANLCGNYSFSLIYTSRQIGYLLIQLVKKESLKGSHYTEKKKSFYVIYREEKLTKSLGNRIMNRKT